MTQLLPKRVKPQLARLADEAPDGKDWLHEVKYDGCLFHARIESRGIKLLTRTGLDRSPGCQAAVDQGRMPKFLAPDRCYYRAKALPGGKGYGFTGKAADPGH